MAKKRKYADVLEENWHYGTAPSVVIFAKTKLMLQKGVIQASTVMSIAHEPCDDAKDKPWTIEPVGDLGFYVQSDYDVLFAFLLILGQRYPDDYTVYYLAS